MLFSWPNSTTAHYYGCAIIETIARKKNMLHERSCRLIYNDKRSSFEDLLEKDISVSIHQKNLQALAIEMFQVHTKTSPEIIQDVFQVKDQGNYNLRNQTDFVIPQVKSVNHGLEIIRSLRTKNMGRPSKWFK